MDILCLMGLFPQEYEKQVIENSIVGIQNAANKLQWAIVRGLDENNDRPVTICNSLYIGSYPKKYKQKHIPSFAFSHAYGANDQNIGFTNIIGFKIVSRYIGVWEYIKRWANNNSGEDKCVIAYAMTLPFVKILHDIKKKYNHIKICLIVPDLPEYMNVTAMQTNAIYKLMKNIEILYIRHCLKNIDNYVFLTEQMKNWFSRQINYVVIEGMCSLEKHQALEYPVFTDGKKHIVYTGGVKREYGVLELVESFMQINKEGWVLDIFGDGVHLKEGKMIAKADDRIVFHGSVPNSISVQAQQEADLLINPRKNHEFAKYSFPSKIIEYMLSGTPIVAYKLDGIPSEYYDYFIPISEEVNGMKSSLIQAIELSEEEKRQIGIRAKEFVLKYKNYKIQTSKIIDMLFAKQI